MAFAFQHVAALVVGACLLVALPTAFYEVRGRDGHRQQAKRIWAKLGTPKEFQQQRQGPMGQDARHASPLREARASVAVGAGPREVASPDAVAAHDNMASWTRAG